MFQSFENGAEPALVGERVRRLRELMSARGIDAFLVPRADEHQNEYIPACSERLKYITGFTGSAGVAAIARRSAALFVDGRYKVQARAEVDETIFEIAPVHRPPLSEWLTKKLQRDQVVGFDPWLHTIGEIERLSNALMPAGIKLRPVPRNLVDRVWGRDRPSPPLAPVTVHPLKHAGRTAADKIGDIQQQLKKDGQSAVILTLPDSIAWAFNIRGRDVPHNPVVLAFAIIPAHGKAELFIAPEKLDRTARVHLEPVAKLSSPAALAERVKALRQAKKSVRLDPETAAFWFKRSLGSFARGQDPCRLPKARKNAAEIRGARTAHVRDGAALARFLAWLDAHAPGGMIDEIEAVRRLETVRAETQALREISFDTIAGSGPNGAIVHYRVTHASNRKLAPGELFLLDSGAQYADGTTDVTRTIAIGRPTEEMRRRFTLVLKGHIAIATARFPKGTRGVDIDAFARRALWEHGLDYEHGTGHGVGSYLSVHEGPQSISRGGTAVLEPGMICSNEPGYYKEGAYGIRIENLVLVTEPAAIADGDREMLGFETLTLVPIDRRLVLPELLAPDELAWLNAYHARVREIIAPEVDPETRAWLEAATEPLPPVSEMR